MAEKNFLSNQDSTFCRTIDWNLFRCKFSINHEEHEHLDEREWSNLISKSPNNQSVSQLEKVSIHKKVLWTCLVVYASMTNQSPENNLKARTKVHLMRSGILDSRGKPLLKELEQITLSDIKTDHLKKFFTLLDQFHLDKVQTPELLIVNALV